MTFKMKMKGKEVEVENTSRLSQGEIEQAVADSVEGAKPFVLGVPSRLHIVPRDGQVLAFGWANLVTRDVTVTVGDVTTRAGFSHTLAHELRHLSQGAFGMSGHVAREADARKVGLKVRRFVRGRV